jgi:hypothetical protein
VHAKPNNNESAKVLAAPKAPKNEAPGSSKPPNASLIGNDRDRHFELSSDDDSDNEVRRKLNNRKRKAAPLPHDLERHRSKRSPSLDLLAQEQLEDQVLKGSRDAASDELTSSSQTAPTSPLTSRASPLGPRALPTSKASLGSQVPPISRASSLGSHGPQTSRASLGSQVPLASRDTLGSHAHQTSRDNLGSSSSPSDLHGTASTQIATESPSSSSKETAPVTPNGPSRSASPDKRQVGDFAFAAWSPSTQAWINLEDMPQTTQTLIKARFTSLYKGKGKTYKDRAKRFARITDPKNIANYLDKNVCLAGYFIDKKAHGIMGNEACATCVRLCHARICVQLVTVGGETKFGIMPLPEDQRAGSEGDASFWFNEQ